MSRLFSVYRAAFQGLPREVWILSIVLFINRCGSMVLPFLVLYLTSQRGFTPSEAGEVLAVYGAGAIIGVGAGGWLVDRIGYRIVQIGSLTSAALTLLAFSVLRERPALLAGAFCLGCLAEAFRPANGVALAAFAPPSVRARAFGLNRLAINLGWTVGPVLGGFLAAVDYRFLFWVDGGTCLAAAVYLAVALPPSSAEKEYHEPKSSSTSARSPWRDGVFMVAFILLLLQAVIFFQMHSTFPLYLVQERGYSTGTFGLLIIVNTALIVLFEMPLVKLVETRNPLTLVAISCALVGLGFGLLPLSGSLVWIVFLIVLWTIGEMLTAPTMTNWVVGRADRGSRGAYMAAYGIAFSLAVAAAPLVGTRVWEQAGPDMVWWTCLVLGAITAIGFWLLARREAHRA
ncbi:MAG: putative MFS family arabinose efflux permease [Planctomycetota bacterium]